MAENRDRVRVGASDDFHSLRHLMDEFFTGRRGPGARGRDVWVPPTDVYETQGEIAIKMDVPGIKPSSVRVRFTHDEVTVSGYRAPSAEPGLIAYHQMEIRSGYFERRVVVHKPVNPEATTAQYCDGFLWIRIPKAASHVHRTLTIRIRL